MYPSKVSIYQCFLWQYSNGVMLFLNTVPPPVISITASTISVYAGSFVTLNCSAQLSNAVDSPITVTAVWRKNGNVFTSSAHRRVLDPILRNNTQYLAQVIFSPIQLTDDDGAYACEVTVDAELEFVLNTRLSSDSISWRARGM